MAENAAGLDARAIYERGLMAFKSARYAEAIENFRHLGVYFPGHLHNSYLLGIARLQALAPAQSLPALARAARLRPEGGSLYQLQHGRCLGMLGRFGEARSVLEPASRADPANGQLRHYLKTMDESARFASTRFGATWPEIDAVTVEAADRGTELGIFFVRSVVDLDHLVPVVWHWCANKQRSAIIICVEPTIRPADFRLRFIADLPNIALAGLGDLMSPDGAEDEHEPACDRFRYLLERLRGNCRQAFAAADGATTWIFEQISRVCRDLGLGFVSLPRGEQAKVNRLLLIDQLSFEDLATAKIRDLYDFYLMGNETGSEQVTSSIAFSASRQVRVVGSARYCAAWLDQLEMIAIPCPALPDDGSLKIALFIPKAREAIWWEELDRLIDMVARAGAVTLVIQEHPRRVTPIVNDDGSEIALSNEGVTLTTDEPLRTLNIKARENVHVVPGTYPGAGLVRYADMCICLATSMAVDAIRLGKPVLEASYAHANLSLVASHIPETDMRCRDDILHWLHHFLKIEDRNRLGDIFYSSGARARMLAEVIDGGHDDVLGAYFDALVEAAHFSAEAPRR